MVRARKKTLLLTADLMCSEDKDILGARTKNKVVATVGQKERIYS